jgi:hypothetical protein
LSRARLLTVLIVFSEALKDALKEYEDRPKYQRLVIDFERGEGNILFLLEFALTGSVRRSRGCLQQGSIRERSELSFAYWYVFIPVTYSITLMIVCRKDVGRVISFLAIC